MVAVGTEAIWKRFCQVLEIEETLGRDARFADNRSRIANRATLIPALQEIFLRARAEEWLAKFRQANVPAGPIYAVDEALSSPQAQARQVVVELEHPGISKARSIANPIHMSFTPVCYRYAPPRLGEHTHAILAQLGTTPETVRLLQGEGVL
jgi:crotonobetainyl-CoA:carnitine CoA-transferase CaiB-like acyl-CoA transferase